MEVHEAIEALNVALRLQQRSAIAYTHMAGTLGGAPTVEIAPIEPHEHIMRKQEQVDALIRASGGPSGG